jgi:hypothetical protein
VVGLGGVNIILTEDLGHVSNGSGLFSKETYISALDERY